VKTVKQFHEAVLEKGLNFGPMTGFSTMTMFKLTRHYLSSSFWPKNQLLKWNIHPIPLILLKMTSGCPQNKPALKGQEFQDTDNIQKKKYDGTESFSIAGVPKMYPAMTALLD
jgi:hypothetical protein